jgi:hypothetical protein
MAQGQGEGLPEGSEGILPGVAVLPFRARCQLDHGSLSLQSSDLPPLDAATEFLNLVIPHDE